MWSVVTADSPPEDRASLLDKGQAMSDRDAGFCSGGEELDSEGAASAASAPLGPLDASGAAGCADDADEALSPTDASEDSVEVRVRAIAPPPPPPPPPPASPPRKRKCPEPRKSDSPVVAVAPPKKRRPPPAPASAPAPPVPAAGSPFRPWSIEFCDSYSDARRSPAAERLRVPTEFEEKSHHGEADLERLRIPKEAHARLNPTEAEIDRRYMSSPLRGMKSETVTSREASSPCERLSPHQGLCLRLDPAERRYASSLGHSPRPRGTPEVPDHHRLRIDSFDAAERLRVSPNPASRSVKMEPPATPGADDSTSRFTFPPTNPPPGGRSTPRSHHPAAPLHPHLDPHLSPERLRVKPEPPSTPVRSRSGSSDSRFGAFGAESESSRARVKSEHGGASTSRGESSGGFSVAALLGASDPASIPGPSSAPQAPSSTSSQHSGGATPGQQRNYKNMTRERRIEANARERTRVHTISAAFDTLRRSVPAYSHAQKLSKLSVLRVACAYILTLSRAAGKDYSADGSEPSLESCVDLVTRTIHTEGKLRRKRDE